MDYKVAACYSVCTHMHGPVVLYESIITFPIMHASSSILMTAKSCSCEQCVFSNFTIPLLFLMASKHDEF
jgi:hypothetical protein